MQMELANHVAERADIDLVALRVRLEKACRQRRLFDEKRAVARIDVGQFDEAVGDVANSSMGGLLF
jgi:hypothetical protein